MAREKFVINSNETNTSLSHKLSKIGALQLLEVINNFEFISKFLKKMMELLMHLKSKKVKQELIGIYQV